MSVPHVYVGIDPGASGCIVYRAPGQSLTFCRLDRPGADAEALRGLHLMLAQSGLPAVVFLEKVGGFIGKQQPGSAMFNFGKGVGRLEGLMEGLGIPYRQVVPQVWQKGIPGVAGLEGADRKRALKAEAIRRYPDVKVTLDNCDALLIFDYAKTFTQ